MNWIYKKENGYDFISFTDIVPKFGAVAKSHLHPVLLVTLKLESVVFVNITQTTEGIQF